MTLVTATLCPVRYTVVRDMATATADPEQDEQGEGERGRGGVARHISAHAFHIDSVSRVYSAYSSHV